MMRLSSFLLTFCLLFSSLGCVPLLVTTGVAGGIVLSVDTVRLDLDATVDRAWEETLSVLEDKGKIVSQDREEGVIRARIQDTAIAVYIARVTYGNGDSSTWVDVSARRRALPNVDLAFDIINEIQGRF